MIKTMPDASSSQNLYFLHCFFQEIHGIRTFIPGKMIMDEETQQLVFVPGKMVFDGKNGPRFWPGQVIESEDGDERFIPGQIMDSVEDGIKRFVPGQIIETKSGPVFIPGQVLRYTHCLNHL